jgi:rhamnosyltransferase
MTTEIIKLNKVCVLLSTYNGGLYLKQLIESILQQTEVIIDLKIRDDGSTDNTISIIKDFLVRHKNIQLIEGNNIGPARSFIELLDYSKNYDFYAFADQDDFWHSDKIITALRTLTKEEPMLYFSNLNIVDINGVFYRKSHSNLKIRNKYNSLTEDTATGCTMVFNKKLRDLSVINGSSINVSMHDSWIYLICSFFGKVVYDPAPHIDYRQHGNNVVGTYNHFIPLL